LIPKKTIFVTLESKHLMYSDSMVCNKGYKTHIGLVTQRSN